MKKYDVIVIGAGSGLQISSYASSKNLKVALIEKSLMGGTCLNIGCIPSKILIRNAEVAETIKNSAKFNINSKITSINIKKIIENKNKIIVPSAQKIKKAIQQDKNITFYNTTAKFVNDKTIQVGKETITGKKIFIFAGTRNLTPPIQGLDKTPYITSTEALQIKKIPKTLTIIGGGYIAAEISSFFSALGTKINIIQRAENLLNREDEELAKIFTKITSKKHNVLLNTEAIKTWKKGNKIYVQVQNLKTKKKKTITSDQLLIAVGRVPNTDSLQLEKTKIKLNERKYIKTNSYLETTVPGVWAGGDIIGNYLFKHSANFEAQQIIINAFTNKKEKINYHAMPHAVFSTPEIAGVGYTEKELKTKKIKYVKGEAHYKETGMGMALKQDGQVKLLVDKKTTKILGCHIIGQEAATLLHEVLIAMKTGKGTLTNLTQVIHIHPALSEVVQKAAIDAAENLF